MKQLILLVLSIGLSIVLSSISFNIYNNSVLDGKPSNIITLNSLNYSIPYDNHPISAQILGTLLWDNSINLYYFQCNFDNSYLFGFIWIDDHLICAPGVYSDPIFAFWNLTFTNSAYSTRKSFIRINIYSKIPSNTAKNTILNIPFNVLWSIDNVTWNNITNNYLSTNIPEIDKKRLLFQQNIYYNTWSTWFL